MTTIHDGCMLHPVAEVQWQVRAICLYVLFPGFCGHCVKQDAGVGWALV